MLASSSGTSTWGSRRVVAPFGAPGRSPCQLRAANKPVHVLGHGPGSWLGARRVAVQRMLCWATAADADGEPIWARQLITAARQFVAASEEAKAAAEEAKAAAEEAKAAAAAAANEAKTTRGMLRGVLEAAAHNVYSRLGVKGASTVLQSVDDVLQFVLPCHIMLTAGQDYDFFRTVRAATTATMLDKDTGFLNAVIVLLKAEGMEQEAGEVEAILHGGTGVEAASDGLRTVQRCLQAAESRAKASGLGDDIRAVFKYAGAKSTQERAALLETTLFVRCAAATLRGSCTGVLEVDVGGGVGFEVDQGVNALRLRAGETKNSPEEMDDADEQLQTLFLVVAFTLDKVLAAAVAAPAASKARAALAQLPRRFIMDGCCVYAGKASEQQLQRRKAAADRRTVVDGSVVGGGGLESAVLQMHFERARYEKL